MTTDARELHGLEALARIEDEWSALCDRADCTVFQRPEWLLPFARTFECPVTALAIRQDGTLVGLLPMSWHTDAGLRVWQLLGTGLSDYLDAIVDTAHSNAVAASATAWLSDGDGWDAVDLQQLPGSSVLLRLQGPAGTHDVTSPHEPCPAVPLDDSSLDRMPIPAPLASKVEYYTRRARARHLVTFESATIASCEEGLAALCRLHERRWAARGGGVLGDERVRAFHRRAVARLAVRGRLAMHMLRLDDAIAAVTYGFRDEPPEGGRHDHARRAYYYIGGFDPAFADLSPGTLTIAHAIACAVRDGSRSFEFLRGRERYKYWWGARNGATFRRQWRRRRW